MSEKVAQPKGTRPRARKSVPKRDDLETADAPMEVFGAFAQEILEIPTTVQAPLFAFGRMDGQTHIAPFVDFKIRVRNIDGEELAPFTAKVTYENVGFLILDMIRDFDTYLEALASVSNSSIAPHPGAIRNILRFLTPATSQLNDVLAKLRALEEIATQAEANQKAQNAG